MEEEKFELSHGDLGPKEKMEKGRVPFKETLEEINKLAEKELKPLELKRKHHGPGMTPEEFEWMQKMQEKAKKEKSAE